MWPFRRKTKGRQSWQCAECGRSHSDLPTSFSWELPYEYFLLNEQEKATFVEISDSLCHIADDRHFVRCNLSLPIQGTSQELLLGIWIGVSKTNFYRLQEFWADESAQPDPPPLFGVISGVLPGVDPDRTLWTEIRLEVRRNGLVPAIHVDDPANPLFPMQQSGISQEYLHAFVRELMPDVAARFGLT